MSGDSIFPIELTAVDRVGSPTVYRFTTGSDFSTGPDEVPPNQPYLPLIVSAGNYERHAWSRGTTRGTSTKGFGVITIANDDGAFDILMSLGVDGQPIVIRKGPNKGAGGSYGAYPSQYPPYFTGTMRQIQSRWNALDIVLIDMWGDISQRPFQQIKYLGTNVDGNGLEGTPNDILGKPKPKLRGTGINFSPTQVNSISFIFQIDDGTALTSGASITVYDKMQALPIGTQRSSLAAFLAGTPAAGYYDAYFGPEGWYIKTASQPTRLTCDASEGHLADRTMAQIVSRIASQEGGVPLANISGVAALDQKFSAECGIWVGDELTIQNVIDAVLDSGNGFFLDDRAGLFTIDRLEDPSGKVPLCTITLPVIKDPNGLTVRGSNDPGVGIRISASVTGSGAKYLSSQDATIGLPTWRVIFNYARCYTVVSGADLVGASAATIMRVSNQYRVTISADPSVQIQHVMAPEFTVTSLIVQPADAQAESDRQLALRKVPRYVVEVPLDPDMVLDPSNPSVTASTINLMATVALAIPRFGWSAGKLFSVIGTVETLSADKRASITTLILWG